MFDRKNMSFTISPNRSEMIIINAYACTLRGVYYIRVYIRKTLS